jgi:hypothetical protein
VRASGPARRIAPNHEKHSPLARVAGIAIYAQLPRIARTPSSGRLSLCASTALERAGTQRNFALALARVRARIRRSFMGTVLGR